MNQRIKQHLENINRQIKELVSIYRDAVSHSGISENEFWIWFTLIATEGEYSQQDICSLWSMSKQTVNTIITHMVQKEYVTLEVVPGTRNRKIIRLTDTGTAYGTHLVSPVTEAEERSLARFSSAELDACSKTLNKYINILKEELYGNKTN